MYPKDFSIILGILLVAIWIYLLLIQKINQWGLIGLVAATAILVGILFNIENIGSIGVKTKETEYLVKIKEIRDEVYAKAQTVQLQGVTPIRVFS